MPFERGWWLLALVLLIPFAYWLIRAERRRRDDLATLAHASILPNLTPDPLRTRLRIVALTAAVGCLLLAVAGWRRSLLDDVPRNDRDILIVVDTSLSMAAQDIEPSRMEYARDVIRGLLQRAQGERVGIVAFSGTAILQCPLTRDYAAVSMYANSLIPGMLPVPGTAVGDALRQAISAFSDDHSRARLVLLMTDGEDHDDPPSQIAQQLRQNGIRFFALGIGTESGAPIPLIDAN
ncbi:MAG: VWA domain-containing protein, partial [Candidatus Poribacteria bacterium]|nr:VWA domain-containing protein [Candidatus Poribacteria bacterium]